MEKTSSRVGEQASSLRANAYAIVNKAPLWMLAVTALAFSILFTATSIRIHGVMGTTAYDLGIFDQAFWLYSQFLSSFNTIRGVKILGDHFSPIAFIFAPLYRIWPDIAWALALQTMSVAAGGVMLFYIVRHILPGKAWLGLVVVASYYVNPVVHNTLLWQYHELVLASGLYMALIWSYIKDRPRVFLAALVLLLMCREDMPFTLAAFGVLALIEKRWRYAAWAIVLSVLWWVVATRIAIPHFNGVGYFRHTNGVLSTLFANIFNPGFYIERLTDQNSLRYLMQVFLPVGLIGLFSPRYMLPALPTLAANVLIGAYNVNIGFHYSVSIMPFLFWAALATLKKADGKLPHVAWFPVAHVLAGLMLVGAGWLYSHYSVLSLRALPEQYRDWKDMQPKREFLRGLDEKFGNDGVAASDYFAPHLTHREKIYLFPNPWKVHYWGVNGEAPHHPNEVQHIVLSADAMLEQQRLYDYLIESGSFVKVAEQYGIIVLDRAKPEHADRATAISQYNHFSQVVPPAFRTVALSPTFSAEMDQFDRLDMDISALQKGMALTAKNMGSLMPGATLDLELGEEGKSDFMTRYVRTELHAVETLQAVLDLGSDDGVTVWHNQQMVHRNMALRAANVEDDHVPLILKPGKNVIVFRVNNATGAWRLQAKIRAQRCVQECL